MADIRILGPDGQPIRTQELTREIAAPMLAGIRNAWTGSIAGNLTPSRLAAILAAAAEGQPYDFLTLAEDMEERDPHYGSVLGTRKRAISGLDIVVESPTDDADDVRRTDAVRELIRRPEFAELVDAQSDAIGKGFSVSEIMWQRGSQWWPRDYVWRDPHFFTVDETTGRQILLLTQDAINGEPLQPYKFIVHFPRLKSGMPLRGGVARLAAVAFMCKSYTLTDWMAFAEVFGMPLRVGKYGPNPDPKDLDILRIAVSNLGSDAAAVIPKSMEIELTEAAKSGGGHDLFLKLAEYLDKQVSKAVLGQTMTTDDGSSMSQAKVHNDVRLDILHADVKALAATLNRDLVKPFIDLNFGPQKAYPSLRFVVPEPEDIAQLTDALARLVPLGFRVEQSVVRDILGLPDPEKDAEVLGSPAPAETARAALKNDANGCGCPVHALARQTVDEDEADLIDLQIEAALQNWEPLMEPIIAPVLAAVEAATSFDDLRDRLAQVYPDMDVSKLVQSLATNTLIARGLGDTTDAV